MLGGSTPPMPWTAQQGHHLTPRPGPGPLSKPPNASRRPDLPRRGTQGVGGTIGPLRLRRLVYLPGHSIFCAPTAVAQQGHYRGPGHGPSKPSSAFVFSVSTTLMHLTASAGSLARSIHAVLLTPNVPCTPSLTVQDDKLKTYSSFQRGMGDKPRRTWPPMGRVTGVAILYAKVLLSPASDPPAFHLGATPNLSHSQVAARLRLIDPSKGYQTRTQGQGHHQHHQITTSEQHRHSIEDSIFKHRKQRTTSPA